jgi:hypothetical protein
MRIVMAVDQPIIFVVDEIVLRRAIARIIDVRTWHFTNVEPIRPIGPVSEVDRTKYARCEPYRI